MNMNKDLEDFSIVYDNGMNNNNFVDSLCHPEFISESQEEDILKRVPNDRELVGAHKAFTLSESLIMMAIVGVIAVITLVSLSGLKPNKDKLLLQKAHRATLEAVAEIANDTVAYPPLQSADASFRGHLLFAARRQVEMALFTPDLTQAITGDGVDCTIYGTPGGDPNPTVPTQLMCSKLDANGNPVTRLNSDGLTEFVYTTDCKKNPPKLTLDPIDTSTFNTGNTGNTVNTGSNTIEILKPTGGGHSDSVLPNIGSVGETTTSGNVKITPASAVLTDRSVPKRDSGKYTSENKFAYLFAHIMQPSGKDISCNNKVCTFNTSDGMSWTVTDNFSAGNVNSTATIKVDINGDKKPNKAYNPDKPTEVKTPDQFTFTVRANGQVTVPANDAVAQKYLQSRK
ncbi:MAG: hypothetical protein DKM24_02790 [Candidatus Melainabacteria bacterium]|nr:MAG: hypothetical protein DKM24_02790 [Candidatus Melainabacteria bacterium]